MHNTFVLLLYKLTVVFWQMDSTKQQWSTSWLQRQTSSMVPFGCVKLCTGASEGWRSVRNDVRMVKIASAELRGSPCRSLCDLHVRSRITSSSPRNRVDGSEFLKHGTSFAHDKVRRHFWIVSFNMKITVYTISSLIYKTHKYINIWYKNKYFLLSLQSFYASIVLAALLSWGDASLGRMFTSSIVSCDWDVEDDAMKIPSSSRVRREKDSGFWEMSSSAVLSLPPQKSSCSTSFDLLSWWEESRSWRVESSGVQNICSWWSGPLGV